MGLAAASACTMGLGQQGQILKLHNLPPVATADRGANVAFHVGKV